MCARTDGLCHLCQEQEETVLHLLGQCPALLSKRLDIRGSHFLNYEDLATLHWNSLLRLAKASKSLNYPGCTLGYAEAGFRAGAIPWKKREKEST